MKGKAIFKYALETEGRQRITMPEGAEILSIQTQFDDPKIWVLVDPTQDQRERIFEIYGTGHPIESSLNFTRTFIGTYQLEGGNFVGHVFEINYI